MKTKTFIVGFLILVLILSGIPIAKASYSLTYYSYSNEISQLKAMGAIDSLDNPDSIITRGELVKALVITSGLGDYAATRAGATIFSDIKLNDSLSGYINTATDKNIMGGTSDGRFHPEGNINLAQICTTMVRALGYSDQDITGLWPKNYILKAKTLGLLEGINLGNSEGVPRWAAAVMLSRLLDTNTKKSNQADADRTYANASGLLNESYQFSMINNPVYSKPEVAVNFDPDYRRVGSIDISYGMKIVKNGQLIDISQIEDNDVVYRVSDVMGTKKYILALDSKIQGVITDISAKGIGIDGKNYDFGNFMSFGKLNSNEFKAGEYITVLLGYDGKVVDLFDIEHQENGNFAFVVNYSSDINGYNVKLLMIDGNTRTFKVYTNSQGYKGQLVNYTMVDNETVSLASVSNNSSGEYNVQVASRLINDSYVSHNVKIFNLVSGNVSSDQDVNVNLIKWSDLPTGTMTSGKIVYMHKSGAFNDINVMLVNSVLSLDYKIGLVKNVTDKTMNVQQVDAGGTPVVDGLGRPVMIQSIVGHTYSIIIDGTEKSWSDSNLYRSAESGEFVKVEYLNNAIRSILETEYLATYSNRLEIVEADRIKVNSTIYYFNKKPVIYFRDYAGNYTLVSINDITANKYYNSISIYLDKPLSYGGKVDAILVQQ